MVERTASAQIIRPVYGCARGYEGHVGQKDAFEIILRAPVSYRSVGIYENSKIYAIQIEELGGDGVLLDHQAPALIARGTRYGSAPVITGSTRQRCRG